ncbi:MAG: 16S rRNA (guanine(527)-N(7))-methyltransferase RsmG, partial [Proteobacteria bacterium]|nr:16S rRNA (guanine(527)-N(7))-methyltransferase RsmG [Pseudomonadota bacterium]
IKGNYCIDVGTGAGLPGLILAIAQPARHWVLLDSNQKKLRFIQHVKAKLNIKNVDIVHARVELFQPDDIYDSVICRAYTSLYDFYMSCRHLVKVGGELLAMKAKLSEEELSAVKSLVNSVVIKKLTVPNIEATRSLVIMSD